MTKKIKDLTREERFRICATQRCDTCPYIFFNIEISQFSEQIEEKYRVCLANIGRIMEREVEVDAIDKR